MPNFSFAVHNGGGEAIAASGPVRRCTGPRDLVAADSACGQQGGQGEVMDSKCANHRRPDSPDSRSQSGRVPMRNRLGVQSGFVRDTTAFERAARSGAHRIRLDREAAPDVDEGAREPKHINACCAEVAHSAPVPATRQRND